MYAELDALKALSKALPVGAWKEPSQYEIEVTCGLYTEILNRIDTDIKHYRIG
jgi:hypothetical protein